MLKYAHLTYILRGANAAPFSRYYASLGATSDFADSLLIFAYDRQTACDPRNAPYYLECLQDLAQGRKSEVLETKAVLMESEGQISRKDIEKAYQFFGMDPRARELDDDSIIGSFRSRVGDAPKQEAEARRELGIIGLERKSDKIQYEAANCERRPFTSSTTLCLHYEIVTVSMRRGPGG